MTRIIICPGIHEVAVTDHFLKALKRHQVLRDNYLIFPTNDYPAFSSYHLLQFLQQQLQDTQDQSIIFLSFSAGVVAAMGAALLWQRIGGQVRGLIAFDGWGVPLFGDFPIHRFSHDQFTHWSSALLGRGQASFYADPPVEHLDLWREIDHVTGWLIDPINQEKEKTTAIAVLANLTSRSHSRIVL